ncbi:MAG TPA: AAA family ATPase [Thiobacillus sp.]|nr:MAG: hypothetical protein B7Y50_05315 [Hydrogenophilales bacterium 28-61-11]OYZ58865.1 MAG: hypothetical protein B7Y21_01735 [Hydrogenophilales bacterium 16-61-112]HQT30198.1 AAA family ATPase [Thiobacillus sp.]HQT69231.1 AAA family ATPase [Thiobacillus sp.]
MKIERIDLKAYGHFTRRAVVLESAASLHIICGPNEAGKTTLWRAINGALFGIPEASRDAFLHDKKLRIGLALISRSGERLAVMRRKGRKNTLLPYDPATGEEGADSIAEDVLRDWLGGLSEGLFRAMFSLDHETLVKGGEALVQGRNDAGENLFEAGSGLSTIHDLRKTLELEAASLFKPRGSTQALNKALSAYDVARRQAKDAAVRPAEWTAAKAAMDTADKAYQAARQAQAQTHLEARRLERLAAILPDVAALAHSQQRLAGLIGVPALPLSAPAERVAAVTRQSEALDAGLRATQRLQHRQAELAAIQLNAAVLADAESIEALHHATPGYRDARLQAARLEAGIEQAQAEFDAVLQQVAGNASADECLQALPDPTRLARIRALVTTGATLKADHQACLASRREKTLGIEQLDADILSLGQDEHAGRLSAYLDSISDIGDPEGRAQQRAEDAAATAAKLDTEALVLKMPSVESASRTTVPLDAEVQACKTGDEELRRLARAVRESIVKIEDDLAALQAEIRGLEIRGEVPTREALAGERAQRDSLWQGIRRYFMSSPGEPVAAEPPPAERYEQAVVRADQIADSLFADAERAARYAEFRVRESQMQAALELAHVRAASLQHEQAQLDRRWTALLATHGLPALQIIEAGQWLARREALLQRFEANQATLREARLGHAQAQAVRARLTEIYRSMGLPGIAPAEQLAETLARARSLARQYAEQLTGRQLKQAQRAATAAALKQTEAAESASRAELDAWKTAWADVMAAIRLAGDATEEEATAQLEQFAVLRQAHASLARLRIEQRNVQIQVDDYPSRLEKTWLRIMGQPLPADDRSHDALAGELYRELTQARAQHEKQKTLAGQVADDQLAIELAQQAATGAAAVIDTLLRQAGCTTLEHLERVEQQSAQRTTLEAEIRDIEDRLVKSSGLSLADALAQARGQDPDAVARALAQNAQHDEQNAARLQAQHAAYIAARQGFEKMDGSAAAADAQQTTAELAARIGELGAEYAASRIASAVLAQVIDTYQKRNQGPLIERASQRFATLTGGRFGGVVIDYDEQLQILKAVRADGERLGMDQLSTGRRDQLFLALRLAAIEGHLDQGEPLPVIVDDILIQFDDEAAAATFKVLADLAQRTQVLFLTHHVHLLEVAEAAIGAAAFRTHRLDA